MRASVLAVFGLVLVGCSSSLEKAVVGTWKAQIDTSGMKESDRAQAEMGKFLFDMITFQIHSDKTITADAMGGLGFTPKGTWSVNGNTLTVTAADGKTQTGRILDGGEKIELQNMGDQDMKGAKIVLVKVKPDG